MIPKRFRILLGFAFSTAGVFVYLFFTPSAAIASFSSFFQIPLPNPLGNFQWALLYSLPVGLFSIIPIVIISGAEPET